MLVKPHKLIADAMQDHFAIGAFNISNLEFAQAIVGAATARRSPVIVQTSEGAIKYGGLDTLAGIVKSLADATKVPVILHLDHGKSLEIVERCVRAGYGSVMIDASTKNYDENVAVTRRAATLAHEHGVWVEAELGAILGTEGAHKLDGGQTPDDYLTDADQVRGFVRETGVDALAVSVGTIHGAFTGQEYIRFELLAEIEKRVPKVPLVVHGASGIASDHLQRVATSNVCKINVDTEMRIAFEQAVKAYFDESHDKTDPRKILGPARDAVQALVEEKLILFGSEGKAAVS